MSLFQTFIRQRVKANPQLKLKLKQADRKDTPFQYYVQTYVMTIMSTIALGFVLGLMFKKNLVYLIAIESTLLILGVPLMYFFFFSLVDVQIKKLCREQEGDLLFVSEYLLVSLESGLPLGNAIQRLSQLSRPGGKFFKRVYTDFKTGKDLEQALEEAATYTASPIFKVLLKRLKDSLSIGVDLKQILENFIDESSEKKIIAIKGFTKKLNPVVMMYLLLGIVVPSLGITFFIIGAAIMQVTPALLKLILVVIFMAMFLFQYFAYSIFKFQKETI
jgi:pilus assembly protein TadC